jgi:hypothetical protein
MHGTEARSTGSDGYHVTIGVRRILELTHGIAARTLDRLVALFNHYHKALLRSEHVLEGRGCV